MSPTTVARCGLPSTPEIASSVDRRFTRSSACGCTCQVQPLSTTKETPLRPVLLACALASLLGRLASKARAVTEGSRLRK
eukprot:1723578-Pleurochrysis_carterae.AAC.1